MSQQASITSYFGKRKRIGSDDLRVNAKKINLDTRHKVGLEQAQHKTVKDVNSADKITRPTKDVKETKGNSESSTEQNKAQQSKECDLPNTDSPVKFQLLGGLSPTKKTAQRRDMTKTKSSVIAKSKAMVEKISKMSAPSIPAELTGKNHFEQQQPVTKLASIAEVSQIIRNVEKTPVKKSASIPFTGSSQTEESKIVNVIPKLTKFDSLDIEVPKSPHKSALYSPLKKPVQSPAKLSHQRLGSPAKSSNPLPLPFGFQKLFELFCAVDTVSSMMVNRGESVTFKKLKPAVQEMTRKNFTLRHLGQMASVLPSAFTFSQEKLRNFGSTSKADSYQLVVAPVIPKTQEHGRKFPIDEDNVIRKAERMTMSPNVLKTRKKAFYDALLQRTMDHHEEFLKSFDPPLTINRSELKRWHPNFMVDHVPDVIPQELPQPPENERPSSARDVLERARDFLSRNDRLQKALEAASQSSGPPKNPVPAETPAPAISSEAKQKIDAKLSKHNPLKGISASLLERIRAKEAAKALEVMRMTPQEENETLMYMRLPDIARIVRTLFVDEQKAILLWETVIEKVQFSFKRNLSNREIEAHVKLLVKHLPEWLSIVHMRKTDYLKMCRKAQMTAVMEKLEGIVTEKRKQMIN